MKRIIVAALAAMIILPTYSSAQMYQLDRPQWGPRIRVTPFIGFAPAVSRTEQWTFLANGFAVDDRYDVQLATGPAAGVSVETQLVERLALMVSAAWVTRGETIEESRGTSTRFVHNGSNFLFGKAALALRLREQVSELQVHTLTGTLFVGPAVVREMPKADPSAPNPVLLDPSMYYGVNFGLDALIPVVSDKVTFQAGVEDYYIWWNDTEMARRNDIAAGGTVQSAVTTDPSHNWLIRAGVSLRVR
jgi:hypothetical protein